jgi:hypothetical protein
MGFMILLSIPIFSQVYVKGSDISQLDIKYCEITIKGKGLGFSGKVRAMADYGQDRKLLSDNYITDGNGKDIDFDGLIAVINFMYKNGWEIKEFFTLSEGDKLVYHYLFSKK